jgi:hypothetical protein
LPSAVAEHSLMPVEDLVLPGRQDLVGHIESELLKHPLGQPHACRTGVCQKG